MHKLLSPLVVATVVLTGAPLARGQQATPAPGTPAAQPAPASPPAPAAPAPQPVAAPAPPAAQAAAPVQPWKFSGLMFGDYYVFADSHDPKWDGQQGFWFRRIYFTFDYTFSPRLMTRLRLEANSNGTLANTNLTAYRSHRSSAASAAPAAGWA